MKKQVKRRNAAKPRAIQTSRLWRLSHRTHSGRILPRRNTSYPILVMIVLCMGVFLMGWTRVVNAVDSGSYDVEARVAGQAPTIAATIDLPLNGSISASKPVTVSGTCPSSTYVELFRNNFPSGIALCNSSGHYSITSDLFIGSNQLISRVYSFSDTPGPDSSAVSITYDPLYVEPTPSKPPSSTSNTDTSEDDAVNPAVVKAEEKSPIKISSDFTYLGHYIGDKIKWQLNISGGLAPYAVSVDWGDGKTDIYTQKQDGQLTISHRYKKTGGYKGSYSINIKIVDDLGSRSFLQLIAIVNNPSSGSGFAGGSTKPLIPGTGVTSDRLTDLVKYAWPTYGVVVLMLSSFWLGETHELTNLKKTSRKPRSR